MKWVGGKRQLLPELRRHYPASFRRYHEPFVGSGAVFFDLAADRRLTDAGARLSDDNPDLIACYRAVASRLAEVIQALEPLAAGHAGQGRDFYLHVRDQQFNPMRAAWRRSGGAIEDYPIDLVAMLIYLNRTGYNGLFRLNASGQYNVPPGRYDSPRVLNTSLLTRAAAVLGEFAAAIDCAPFDDVGQHAREGDFVYFDPPYAPLSKTANFRSYTRRGFTTDDQWRLQQLLIELARRGVSVLLSNSVAPSISALYEGDADVAAAGLRTWRVPARRSVNSRPDRRGTVEELIVSNVIPHDR